MRHFLVSLIILAALAASAQTGPGGVGTADGTSSLHAWWRADFNVTPLTGAVDTWGDNSGYGSNLFQTTPGNRPTRTTSAALNNQPVIHYNPANSQFFNSSFNGPGVNNLTLFVVANGTSYQSLIRFQVPAGSYVVYPWEGTGGRPFIASNHGGTGAGITSGLANSVNNIGSARIRVNRTTDGMQTFLNGAFVAQRTTTNTTLPSENFFRANMQVVPNFPTPTLQR
ncbi:MAG: hypothetical protein WDN75_00865 [Bacteroidota bacterium]